MCSTDIVLSRSENLSVLYLNLVLTFTTLCVSGMFQSNIFSE